MSKGSLLLVDDDGQVLESMGQWLAEQDYDIQTAPGYEQALTAAGQRSFDLVLSDIRMEGRDGFDLLNAFQHNHPDTSVILITGYGTADMAVEAINAGAADFLTKPLIDLELEMAIERVLSQRNVLSENRQLKAQLDQRHGFDNVIGHDPRMIRVFDIVESVADTRASVLISGESGTGKSLIARAIHRRSERRDKPFVEVACGALPENLLESELFGHVAGAFTGAAGAKIGKFKQADGGTIFLDEIGTASPAMQVKLLRVLQELEFEQVGGTQTFKVDVRVILATNEDLSQAVAAGTFREDLYYRVNVINIELPSLSQRSSDIPILAQSFLEKVCLETGKKIAGFTDECIATLERYGWPGNVRQLQNVIERAVLLGKNETIGVEDLPAEMRGTTIIPVAPAGGRTLKEAMEGPERQIIIEVLEANHWNRNATADSLGINRTTLYKKMKKLGLEDAPHGPAAV